MTTITVKNIPPILYKRLKQRAAGNRRSINNEVIVLLEQEVMEKAHALLAEREYVVSSDQVLELAASSRCTAYDCEYVALAQQFGLPLITFDKAVVQNFPAIAMDPQDFLTQGLS